MPLALTLVLLEASSADYAQEIIGMFKSFNQVGVTVVIATHDKSMIAQLGPRVLHLEHGKIVT